MCPNCGASLKYEALAKTSVVFPCPACGVQLGFTKWFVISIFYGAIAAPPMILWALRFSWRQLIVAELLLGYPILWLVCKYGMYVLRPKVVLYVPPRSFAENLARTRAERPPRERGGGPSELRLRDRPPGNSPR